MNYKNVLFTLGLGLVLLGCGPGSKNDQNTPPPDVNTFRVNVETPSLLRVENGTETKLVVNFSVTDGAGRNVNFDTTKDFRIAVLKAMPARSDIEDSSDPAYGNNGRNGNTFWKSYHHASNASDSRASMENVWTGDLVQTAQGYRYTFAIADILQVSDPYPTDSAHNGGFISWDEDKLHRIVFAYGDQSTGFTYVYEWVPGARTDTTVSRNVIENGTCTNCHMNEPLHHGPGYRSIDNNIAVCTACHNDSKPDAAPRRRPLAAIVHQYHGNIFKLGSSSSNLATYKQPVDDNDQLVTSIDGLVIEGNAFPQDARNCTTCHADNTSQASDANNWFEHPTQVACETCHLYRDRGAHANQIGTAWIRNGVEQNSCTGCHRPYERDNNGDPIVGLDASRSAKTVHMTRLTNLAAARDRLQITIEHARFINDQFEVDVSISNAGTAVSSLADITPFINEHGHLNLLLNWDNGSGPVLANNTLDMTLDGNLGNGCIAQGNGLFRCHKDFSSSTKKPGTLTTLTVNLADMPLCGDRRNSVLVDCSTFSGIDLLNYPFVIAATNRSASFDTGGVRMNHQLPVAADISSCNDCHQELTIHKLGDHPHAATDFQQCKNCHNSERSAFYPGMAADLKYHVHSFHAFGSARSGTSSFPGALNNCEGCHTAAQYNLPSSQNTRPSLASGKYFSPALVACGACHLESALANADPDNVTGDAILSHMLNNGAVFAADSADQAMGSEQCASCHAVGQSQGVDKVHAVYNYR